MAMKFVGSICLSDIPQSEIKVVECSDGVKRAFLSISVHENAEPKYVKKNVNGELKDVLISDHFISCAPKKEERKEGVQYIVGNLRTWQQQTTAPTAEEIAAAPSLDAAEDGSLNLPWKEVY